MFVLLTRWAALRTLSIEQLLHRPTFADISSTLPIFFIAGVCPCNTDTYACLLQHMKFLLEN